MSFLLKFWVLGGRLDCFLVYLWCGLGWDDRSWGRGDGSWGRGIETRLIASLSYPTFVGLWIFVNFVLPHIIAGKIVNKKPVIIYSNFLSYFCQFFSFFGLVKFQCFHERAKNKKKTNCLT